MNNYANPAYSNPSQEHRQNNIKQLLELAKELPLPKDWTMYAAEASIRFADKLNNKSVKIDSTCIMTLDIRNKGEVKSNTFKCKNVAEVWAMAAKTLKIYTGVRQ